MAKRINHSGVDSTRWLDRRSVLSASISWPFSLSAIRSSWLSLRDVSGALSEKVLIAVAGIVAALGTGAALVSTSYHSLIVVVYATVILAVLAARWPEKFIVGLVLLLLFPYTWSPTTVSGALPPLILVALPAGLLAAIRLTLRGHLRMNILDWLVCAVVASAFVSEVGAGATHRYSQDLLEGLLIPYFAFRLIMTAWPNTISRLPSALMVTGVCLSGIALWEVLHGSNLFSYSSLTNPNLAQWAVNYPRAGGIRAEATMGHPIALGAFLLIPLVFAYMQRRYWLFTACIAGEVLTLSRGPYIAVIAALVLGSAVTGRLRRVWVAAAVIGALVAIVAPLQNTISESFRSGTEANANASYRSSLLETSLSSSTLLGNPTPKASSLYGHAGQFQLSDVTSEFALLAGRQGLVGLTIWVAFLVAFGYVIRVGQRRDDALLIALGVILVGEWIALLSVALITSFAATFLLIVAMTAARLSGFSIPDTREQIVTYP